MNIADAIDQAQHHHDAAKDCVVELADGQLVVTATVEQAELLRAHLATLAGKAEKAEKKADKAEEKAEKADEKAEPAKAEPAKRAPRKSQG